MGGCWGIGWGIIDRWCGVWYCDFDVVIMEVVMKVQCSFGLVLLWLWVIVVFLVDVLILVVVSYCLDFWQVDYYVVWWVGVGVVVVVMLLLVVSYYGIMVILGLVMWVWDWLVDLGMILGVGCILVIDYQCCFGCDMVGVCEYNGWLVLVIEVICGESGLLGWYWYWKFLVFMLLVVVVVDGLCQFDIYFDGIDIVLVLVWGGVDVVKVLVLLQEWELQGWKFEE